MLGSPDRVRISFSGSASRPSRGHRRWRRWLVRIAEAYANASPYPADIDDLPVYYRGCDLIDVFNPFYSGSDATTGSRASDRSRDPERPA